MPISEIQVGDQVLAHNQKTGETGSYTVTAVLINLDPAQLHLTIAGEQITTTPEHPFYVLLRGWVAASALREGDQVRTADGEYGAVESVRLDPAPRLMYNLTIAEAHTFFVGEEAWLVHNAKKCRFDGLKHSDILDKRLGGRIGDRKQAQHLIPTELSAGHGQAHPLMELARKAGWDNDAAYNGMLLPDNQADAILEGVAWHKGSHANYTDMVKAVLDDMQLSGAYDVDNIIPALQYFNDDLRSLMRVLIGYHLN